MIEPVYQREGVTLYHGDCLAILPQLEAGSVDAVVTDPPYNVGFKYSGDATGDRRHDYNDWCRQWHSELVRLSRNVVLSCGTNNVGLWASLEPDWWLAWWKPAAMGRCTVGFCNWEPMPFWGKVAKLGVDVVRAGIKPSDELDGHPCPKPLDWGIKLVEMMSPLGGAVLDPFTGSGTTGVACIRTGRRFIGIELERKYVDIAIGRIEKAFSEKAEMLPMGGVA